MAHGNAGRKLSAEHKASIIASRRYDVGNGRTLCAPCHRKTPTYGTKAKSALVSGGCAAGAG